MHAGEVLQEKVPEAIEGLSIEIKEKKIIVRCFLCSWKRICSEGR